MEIVTATLPMPEVIELDNDSATASRLVHRHYGDIPVLCYMYDGVNNEMCWQCFGCRVIGGKGPTKERAYLAWLNNLNDPEKRFPRMAK